MKSLVAILAACVALLVTGCSGLTKGKAAAETAVARFHALYNDGQIDDIWQEAHAKFQAATKKETFTALMNAVQRKLGQVTASANGNWNVRSMNLTTTVVMNQKTSFAQGEATETFTFQLDGEKAVLVGYNIQSLDLITK